MASHKPLTNIQAEAQALFAEIQQKGTSVADRPNIVAAAQKLLALLNDLTPHINDAGQAFGNQADNTAQLTALKNRLNKIIATYSK